MTIRIGNKTYNADVSTPIGQIYLKIYSDYSISEIFSALKNAEELSILDENDNNVVLATYRCTFNAIEIDTNGYNVTFNRAPMSTQDVETLNDTVTAHSVALSANASEFNDILDAITELGDMISELIGTEGE